MFYRLLAFVLLVCQGLSSLAQTADKDHYRRSSLCLVLLAHTDKQYADAMTEVFQEFPMPARYNEHNADVRVVRVSGKQNREKIERILREQDIAKDVVARWFNRNEWSGTMNMDLIHERGGYGAFHDDYERAMNTVRGTAMLRDEGVELLESTFVLVCDMEYLDRSTGFKIASVLSAVGSVAMGVASAYNQYEASQAYYQGDYNKAKKKSGDAAAWQAGSTLANATSQVLADVGSFAVRIKAYLYRLRWDDFMTNAMFTRYWVDNETPRAEAERRKATFDNARFGLEYIGGYKAKSGKTHLKSWVSENEVILDVCERSVAKCITSLAKKFEVFRPRTPFYIEGQTLYSHIGTKEDVASGKKYEIVQRTKDKKGRTKYKRIGMARAVRTWNNKHISFDRYFDESQKGTAFEVNKGDLQQFAMTPGLQIREVK